jgi:TBC1 domain family member 10
MGMLVGLLLMRMNAENTFWVLVVLLDKYIPGYHSETLYQLRVDAAAFELCLKRYLKPLSKHMCDLLPLTYMTQWFLTIYSISLPWNTVLRVWDMFLHDGIDFLI